MAGDLASCTPGSFHERGLEAGSICDRVSPHSRVLDHPPSAFHRPPPESAVRVRRPSPPSAFRRGPSPSPDSAAYLTVIMMIDVLSVSVVTLTKYSVVGLWICIR